MTAVLPSRRRGRGDRNQFSFVVTLMIARPQAPGGRVFRAAALVILLFLAHGTSPKAQTLVERTNRGLVTIITGSTDGTALRVAEDLSYVLDSTGIRRILPIVGKGSLQNLVDLRVLRGVDMALVQADVLDYARAQKLMPGIEQSLSYVAKLYDEEFHLLARDEIKSVGDLAGKKVNFGQPGDGTSVTGSILFDRLKVSVQATSYDLPTALELLRSGEIDALGYVAGKPAPLFARISTASAKERFHFISIPLNADIASTYLPAQLTSDDYPELVAPDQPVNTVAVGTVLMVVNFPQGSERYRNLANFVDAFLTQLQRLQEPPRHPKWRDVNVAAELPGWRRFAPADTWLKRNVVAGTSVPSERELREIFSKFLDERARLSGGKAMSADEKNGLFEQFRRWQTSQLH